MSSNGNEDKLEWNSRSVNLVDFLIEKIQCRIKGEKVLIWVSVNDFSDVRNIRSIVRGFYRESVRVSSWERKTNSEIVFDSLGVALSVEEIAVECGANTSLYCGEFGYQDWFRIWGIIFLIWVFFFLGLVN